MTWGFAFLYIVYRELYQYFHHACRVCWTMTTCVPERLRQWLPWSTHSGKDRSIIVHRHLMPTIERLQCINLMDFLARIRTVFSVANALVKVQCCTSCHLLCAWYVCDMHVIFFSCSGNHKQKFYWGHKEIMIPGKVWSHLFPQLTCPGPPVFLQLQRLSYWACSVAFTVFLKLQKLCKISHPKDGLIRFSFA